MWDLCVGELLMASALYRAVNSDSPLLYHCNNWIVDIQFHAEVYNQRPRAWPDHFIVFLVDMQQYMFNTCSINSAW